MVAGVVPFFDFGVPYVRRELGDAESGGSAVVLDAVWRIEHRHGSLEFAAGWVVSSVVLGSLCYGLVQLGWRMGQFLHSRKKSGKL